MTRHAGCSGLCGDIGCEACEPVRFVIRVRCPVCDENTPRHELAAHVAAMHRPTPIDRPRRTVRLGRRGKARR